MPQSFSINRREQHLQLLGQQRLDVLVIGGGIAGAGIAWDAGARGMKTGLVEMNDFASGTSSRSTKLIHGGLRYLKQGEIKLVREVGRERALLHRNAPHLAVPLPMLLPLYKGGTYGYAASSIGLFIYDLLAGVKRGERRIMVNAEAALKLEPLLKREGLIGAGLYYEYRTDDARLTLEILKSAHAHKAIIANYVKVVEYIYQEGKVCGAIVEDQFSGKRIDVYARKIVNAAGPWVDELRRKDGPLSGQRLMHTKGIHLVVDYERFPVKQAAYFDVPDGRMIFVIPRAGKTYIGTTDTVYEGDLADPRITAKDRDYLLHAVNAAMPTVKLAVSDVEAGWAGIRPLIYEEGKGPSEISRKDETFVSPSGLISIAGGKLTGFRIMAKKIVDLVAKQLKQEEGVSFPACTTHKEKISGGNLNDCSTFEELSEKLTGRGSVLGIPAEYTKDLLSRYGSNAVHIFYNFDMIMKTKENLGDGLNLEHSLLHAEVQYAMEHEMAATAIDFLERRTGWLYFRCDQAERMLPHVIAAMADLLGWDADARAQQSETVTRQLNIVKGREGYGDE